jgi:tetratricopeptide (TPR) repeat protein
MLGYFGFMPGDAAFPKARAAAQQALRLDPRDGDAHAALGQALAWEHRWAEAESVYARGTRLDPGNATLHQWYGLLEAYLGRSHAAARETGIAARLEPLSVQINNMHAMMRFEDGDTAGALRHFERTVDAEPDSAWVRQNPWVLDNYAVVAGATGRHALALHLLAHALRVVPTHPRPLLTLAQQHLRVGDTTRAVAAFARVDTTHPHYAVYRGLYLASLGRMDEAFASLDGVREWPLPSLVSLNNGAGNTRLRADPRYRQLRAKLGMPLR